MKPTPRLRKQRAQLRVKREPHEQLRGSERVERLRKRLRQKYRERGLMGYEVPTATKNLRTRYSKSKRQTKELRVSKKKSNESVRTRMGAVLEVVQSPPIARGKKAKGARRPTKKHPWGL